MYISRGVGYAAAAVSPFLMGSSFAIQKTSTVHESRVDCFAYQLYVACGVFIVSLFTLFTGEMHSFVRPFIGGIMLSCCLVLGVFCVRNIGISHTMAITCATGTIVSFSLGKVAFEESSKNVGLALAGLAGVVIGIVLLAYFVEDAEENAIEAKPAANAFNPATSGSGPPPELSHGGSEETVTLLPTQETAGGGTRTYWILGAVLAGVLGGAQLAPCHAISDSDGLGFVASFGAGALSAAILIAGVYGGMVAAGKAEPGEMAVETLPYGLIQGALFGATNICTIVAMESPLGLAVAQPFRECALVVGGLYGYFLFGEMAGRGLFAKFMICALVMMLGILALSVFGEQQEK